MSKIPIEYDELKLALTRVRLDHTNNRVFVTNPIEKVILSDCEDVWLKRLLHDLEEGSYSPSSSQVCEVPKAGGTVRPGSILCLRDQVVYTTCVGRMLPAISESVKWTNPQLDLSYQIVNPKAVKWLKRPFTCWNEFRDRSLVALDAGAAFMVKTDIASYYDAISLELLISDLRLLGISTEILSLLTKSLSRWSFVNGRGIPQGLSASDILGKLYLDRVDHALNESGYSHLRYVDDIRIFCSSRAVARKAILSLTRLLRSRGLNLQTAKTAIQLPTEARMTIDGVIPTLKPLANKYIHDIAVLAGADPSYLTPTEVESLLQEKGIAPPTELLRDAYKAYFIAGSDKFDKTLFHYLIARFSIAKDSFAANHALKLLNEHPEETDYILHYYGAVMPVIEAEPSLLEFLRSEEAVYAYQHYQVLRWRCSFPETPSSAFVDYARTVSDSERSPYYLRSTARLFLGRFGTASDIDKLADSYASAQNDLEQAEILCSIQRMEKGRRNAILGQSASDGFLTEYAVKLVREERGSTVWGITA